MSAFDYDPDAIDFPDHYDLCAWCGQIIIHEYGKLPIPDEATGSWLLEIDPDGEGLCWSCYRDAGGR